MGDAFVICESTIQPCKSSYSKEKEERASLIVCVRVLLLIHCQRAFQQTKLIGTTIPESICLYKKMMRLGAGVAKRLRVLLATIPKNSIPRSNI